MVSVLMCTYNRRFCLKQAIDSVLCQTYPDFEFVIVDDGSTDGTEELIKSYQDPRIRYFKLILILSANVNLIGSGSSTSTLSFLITFIALK